MPPAEAWQRRGEMRKPRLRLCREAMARVDVNVVLPFRAVFAPFMVDRHQIEDEIPVINGVAVGLRKAEMFADLKMVHSKKAYPAAPNALRE